MNPEDLHFRRLVVCVSGLIYWVGVAIQARRVRKRIGRSPNLKPRGLREKALWLGWFVVIVVWLGQPLVVEGAAKPILGLMAGMLNPASLIVGFTLVVLGYAGTLWAYWAMGDTWRIGINSKEKNALVDRGPFRRVRHPIYLFQIVMLAGAALLLPTMLSFGILAIHYFCVHIKARDEEKYLTAVHDEAYREYVARTGGLFPGWIRRHSSAANKNLAD